jgi:hypothetical protein
MADVSFQREKLVFRGPPAKNPLTEKETDLAQLITVSGWWHMPKFIAIASGVLSAQYGEFAIFGSMFNTCIGQRSVFGVSSYVFLMARRSAIKGC